MVSPTKNVHYTKYFRGRLKIKKAVKKPPLCSPRGYSMFCNSLIIKHGLKMNNRLTNSYFRLPFYSPLGSIRVRLSRLVFQRL